MKISLSPEVSAEFKGVSEHTGYSPADHLDKQPLSSVISPWGTAELIRLPCAKYRREGSQVSGSKSASVVLSQ